jgi:hypothetical protein
LAGGNKLYSYVYNVNFLIDPLGLILTPIYTRGTSGEILTGKVTITQTDLGTGTSTNDSSRARARSLGDATDDAGHIFGKELGGSGGVDHIFPQNLKLNRGEFRIFENDVIQKVKTHGSVDAQVQLHYDAGGTRPTRISYMVTTPDGKSTTRSFVNQH